MPSSHVRYFFGISFFSAKEWLKVAKTSVLKDYPVICVN